MAEEKKTPDLPRVDGFKIFAKLAGSMKDVEAKLRTVSFLEVVPERDCVSAAYIESRDIDKNPYSFAVFKFQADAIEVMYTIPPTAAPKKRKLDLVRQFLNMLTALGSSYRIEPSAVYQLMDAALKEMGEFVSMDYNKLYVSYDTIKKDYETATRRLRRMDAEIEALKKESYELKTKNDELALRLKNLESMSNETLREKVQTWISEHEGEINITEFSKFYKVAETKVEEILNVLVNEGYIQPLQ